MSDFKKGDVLRYKTGEPLFNNISFGSTVTLLTINPYNDALIVFDGQITWCSIKNLLLNFEVVI